MKRIYLDWASTAPVSSSAMHAFTRASKAWGNPSSPHKEGREAKDVLEESRRQIARLGGAKPDAVIFTSGATEANGIAIRGHVRALGRAPSEVHLLYLPSAHASTVEAMEALREEGYQAEPLVLTDGAVDLKALTGQLRDTTALVSMDAVCGETGTKFDTRGVREVLDAASHKILLHVDASQLPLVESFERTRLAADLITLDAAKVGGVRGIGVLIAPLPIALAPVIEGGGQERGIRSGTQTPALASAFAAALMEAAEKRTAFASRAEMLREEFVKDLMDVRPDMLVNSMKAHVPHIINISFPDVDTEYLAALLDERGIAVSTRSACETDSSVSRAVFALTQDESRARSTLRISFGPTVQKRDLETLKKALIADLMFLETA